jgi:undecaprenyl-diphosphatase
MPEIVKAILLGIVEGLTEFIPVSSTGHLLITSALLQLEQSERGTFEIFIQLGAVLALLVFYRRDLVAQIQAVPRDTNVQRFWMCVALAFLPAAVLGFLLRSWIKAQLFTRPEVIAWALILGGIAFIVIERRPRQDFDKVEVTSISLRQALVIGIAQSTALVPGVSRSGASIIGGMLAGLGRPTATLFSFYLAIPTLGAATVLDLMSSIGGLTANDVLLVLVGTAVSAVMAAVSIKWLLDYVAHHTFIPFGIYRIVVGIVILMLVWFGPL